MKNHTLEYISKEVRKDIIHMAERAKSAHTGGALSCVEILVSLYFKVMRVYPKQPKHSQRDRLIFSKAHDAKVLYATLAERGFFDKGILKGYESDGGLLPGHSTRHCVAGVEVSAGALGHGLPMAAGMAYSLKSKIKNPNSNARKPRVFVILSDGECDEGSTWEAALFAGHHRLDNLINIIDYNKLQGCGFTRDVLDLEPFAAKWQAFNWETREIYDGHSFANILSVLKTVPFTNGKPSVVIAHTVKGLGGVEKHINQISSQYKPPTLEEANKVIRKLDQL